MPLAIKHHCGADVDIDTDGLGRTIDVCRRCGVLPPGWENSPESIDAQKADLERVLREDRTAEKRKGGRPRKTAAPPPLQPPPPTMPRGRPANGFAKKSCERSGAEFTPTGSRARYCGNCPECLGADATAAAPKKRNGQSPKRAPRETPRRRVHNGYVPESPVPAAAAPSERCTVDGCPGTVDASGACRCCTERARFKAKFLPTKPCEICFGDIDARDKKRKFCTACAPIAAAVDMSSAKRGR